MVLGSVLLVGLALLASACTSSRGAAPDLVITVIEPTAAPSEAVLDDDPGPIVTATQTPLPRVAPGTAAGWQLVVDAIDVSAPIKPFGLRPDGVMDVPADHVTVAWYDFTSLPGSAGNAVLAAHVDWAGYRGVFNRIVDLVPGDLVEVRSPDGVQIQYRVDSVELVDPEDVEIAAVVGTRSGDATITLITCGGTFNRDERDYEKRVIVRAGLVLKTDAA